MNRYTFLFAGVALVAIASPLYAQTKSLPSASSLLQSAYSMYDKAKTLQVRITSRVNGEKGVVETAEMTAALENDAAGVMTRGLLTMKQTTTTPGEAPKTIERHLLDIGTESFAILPLEKKYAPRKREIKHFADLFRSILQSVRDAKTTYSVAEAKMNGVAVYQITSSVFNGLRTQITLEKENRLIRRIRLTADKTEMIDFRIVSQERNVPIPEETFAKPGADYTLDPDIEKTPATSTP